MANFNVTWTVQLASSASAECVPAAAAADLADTDDERVVERWEPGEIISEEEEGDEEEEGEEESARKHGGGRSREDFLGRRTRNSIRRRRGRRRGRQGAQVGS